MTANWTSLHVLRPVSSQVFYFLEIFHVFGCGSVHFSFPEYKSSLLTALSINVILHFFSCTNYYKRADETLIFVQYMSLEFFVLGYQKASFFNTLQSQQRVLCPRCVHVLCSVHTFNRQCQSAAGDSPLELSLFIQTCWTTSPSFSPGNPDMFMDFYLEILTERYLRSFPTFPFQKIVQRNQVLDLLG